MNTCLRTKCAEVCKNDDPSWLLAADKRRAEEQPGAAQPTIPEEQHELHEEQHEQQKQCESNRREKQLANHAARVKKNAGADRRKTKELRRDAAVRKRADEKRVAAEKYIEEELEGRPYRGENNGAEKPTVVEASEGCAQQRCTIQPVATNARKRS